MQVGELISKAHLREIERQCYFAVPKQTTKKRSPEDIFRDDKADKSIQERQANNGGTLGTNVKDGKPGEADTGPYDPKDYLFKQEPNDSNRGRRSKLCLEAFEDQNIEEGDFPFTVAAHHLIPGNASLENDEVGLVDYMDETGTVYSNKGTEYTINGHIGYDVNGSHNGVWLPGNYAIVASRPKKRTKTGRIIPARKGTGPFPKKSWSVMSKHYSDWQFAYVVAACKAGDGQFHDTHDDPYSESVSEQLLKIVQRFASHLDKKCKLHKNKDMKIPPPYKIKMRLHGISDRLRGFVKGHHSNWTRPWFTSSRWSDQFWTGGKISRDFKEAYEAAEETNPAPPPARRRRR
jgi:hypothetical protein